MESESQLKADMEMIIDRFVEFEVLLDTSALNWIMIHQNPFRVVDDIISELGLPNGQIMILDERLIHERFCMY